MSFRRPPKEVPESALSASTMSLKEVLKVGAARSSLRLLPSANVTGPPPESLETDALKEFVSSVEEKKTLLDKQNVTMTEIVAKALYKEAEPMNTDTESSLLRKYTIGNCTIVLKRYFNDMSSIVHPLQQWYQQSKGEVIESMPYYTTVLKDMYTAYKQVQHFSDRHVVDVFDQLRLQVKLDREKAVDEYINGWKVFDTLQQYASLQCLDHSVRPWRMKFEEERSYTLKELYDYGMCGDGPILATVLVSPHVRTLHDYLSDTLQGDEMQIRSKCEEAGTACGRMMFCFKLSTVVHCDMHLGNILIATEDAHVRAVVIDFGLSKDKAVLVSEIDDDDEEMFLEGVKDLLGERCTLQSCMLFRGYPEIFENAYRETLSIGRRNLCLQ